MTELLAEVYQAAVAKWRDAGLEPAWPARHQRPAGREATLLRKSGQSRAEISHASRGATTVRRANLGV
jgi:hypothetical protein